MPIPDLLHTGLLPPGVHECTLEEVADRFGSANDRRRAIQHGLERLVRSARETGMFLDVVIDGSFVTNKDLPGDADVVLRTRGDYWSVVVPLMTDPRNSWLAQPESVKERCGIDAFIDDASGSMVDLFTTLKAEDALERRVDPRHRRGLVRVQL